MSDIAIKVEGVSKQYRLGQVGRKSLSQDVNRWWHTVRGKEDPYLKIGEDNDRSKKGGSDYVWALRDIDFDIKQGEVLGIIGRNGAGKSTLLKLLSKVTAPTTGAIKIKGRIASLLEVGTGFHPDLSGRDNIFLNGAILGMNKRETASKFDEIVDFAGVARYIDTPVKRYSSGMYVRLAFAVAAHLEPEILIVDEVLAVGDAEFQKKCLGKMKDVSTQKGRTVLFVSHQMGSITQLCSRAILLKNGKLVYGGKPDATVDYYLKQNNQSTTDAFTGNNDGKKQFYFKKIFNTADRETPVSEFGTHETVKMRVELASIEYRPSVELAFALIDKRGTRVFTIHEKLYPNILSETKKEASFIIEMPPAFLAPGFYSWIAVIHIPHQHAFDKAEDVCRFSITDTGTNLSDYEGSDIGVVLPKYTISNV